MGEVEAQPPRLHHAARLLHMRPQHLAQGGMQQMRSGMVAPRGIAQRCGHFRAQHVSHGNRGVRQNPMHRQPGNARESRFHVRGLLRGSGIQHPAIAHLAAGLGVERRLVEHQLGLHAGRDLLHGLLVHQETHHSGLRLQFAVAQEPGAPVLQQFLIGRNHRALFSALPARPRPFALALHLLLEACMIDRQAVLASHVLLLVQGQSEGVVKLERHRAWNGVAGERTDGVVELFLGLQEGGSVAVLFVLHHARHALHTLHHLRIGPLHQIGDEPGELVQKRLFDAYQPHVAQRPPHDLAQHVAAPLVGGQDAIVDQEGCGARVVGGNAEGGIDPVCALGQI